MKHSGKLTAGAITDKYIYALLTVFPLFVGFRGYTSTTASKFVLLAALTLLWAVWAGVLLARRRGRLKRPEPVVAGLLGGYLLLILLSALCSPYGAAVLLGQGRFDGLATALLCALAFCAGALFRRAGRGYLYAAVGAGILCCLVGILQLFGLNPLHLFPGDYDYYDAGVKFSSTFFGTIGNADLTSAYLCLLLPLTAVYSILARRRALWTLPVLTVFAFSLISCRVSAGLLACGLTALLLPPVLITGGGRLRRALEALCALCVGAGLALCFGGEKTDGTLLLHFALGKKAAAVLIIAVFALFARLAARKAEPTARALRLSFGILSGLCLLGGLAAVYFFPPESGTLWEISETLHGRAQDSFGSSRILIWREVLSVVPQRLLLGGGPGTLALRIDINFSRYVAETGKTLTAYIDNAHNEYLGVLANTGLLSLLLRLAAQVVSIMLTFLRGSRSAWCMLSALVCYWIQSFFGLGLFIVSPLMWLCWGLLVFELCKPIKKDAE